MGSEGNPPRWWPAEGADEEDDDDPSRGRRATDVDAEVDEEDGNDDTLDDEDEDPRADGEEGDVKEVNERLGPCPRMAPAIMSTESSEGSVWREGSALLAALACSGLMRRHSCPGNCISSIRP